jgi:hypothetical protein
MDVNTNYWQGSATYDGDIKICNSMSTLASNGILIPNLPVDDSIFMFACLNDNLTVPCFVKIENKTTPTTDAVLDIHYRYFKPPISNYFPTVDYLTYDPSSASRWTPLQYPRVGMSATVGNIPDFCPIVEMKTKYLALCIRVLYRTITDVTIDDYGTKHFTISGGNETDYDYFMTNMIGGLGTSYIITGVYASPYYGTATRRTQDPRLTISSSGGNVEFGIDSDLPDENTQESDLDVKLIMPYQILSGYGYKSLYQGGYYNTEIYNNKNSILFFGRANPLFWKFGTIGVSGRNFVISSYIDNETDLQLAFKAYRATGLFFFGNTNDAMNYDLDGDIDPDIANRGAVSDDGKVSGTNGGDDAKGLTDDPTKMHSATGYNGNANVDPNTYTDETPITKPNLSVVSAFNRTYAINYTAIRSLADWLWNADDSKFEEIMAGLGLMGERPIEGIIDVRLYPFDVATLLQVQGTENIKIGRTQSPISGLIIGTSDNAIIDLGSCTFTEKFKSFLDYSPYTEARLYIPYCGIVPIDTAEFMGHEISAKMIVDIVTGACTVMIYRDKIIMYYAQGVCGVSIPFTGTDSSAYASSVLGSIASGVTSIAAGVASGGNMIGIGNSMMKHASQTTALSNNRLSEFNKGKGMNMAGHAAIAGGVGNAVTSFWEAATTPVQYASGGNATPSCSNYQPQYPYFIIDRPIPNVPDGYGHNVGFACIKTGVLSSFSGFTVCSNVDTSGFAQATEAERGELKALLEAGVFL